MRYDPARMVALYRSGSTVAQIAEHMGCGTSLVARRLRENGHPQLRGRHYRESAEKAELARRILALRTAGLVPKQIAHEVGKSPNTVCRFLRASA